MKILVIDLQRFCSTFSLFFAFALSGKPASWAYCRNIASAGKRKTLEGRK